MKDGKEPYWPDNLLKRFVKRAVRAKIKKRVGWHMLRHTYSCISSVGAREAQVRTLPAGLAALVQDPQPEVIEWAGREKFFESEREVDPDLSIWTVMPLRAKEQPNNNLVTIAICVVCGAKVCSPGLFYRLSMGGHKTIAMSGKTHPLEL